MKTAISPKKTPIPIASAQSGSLKFSKADLAVSSLAAASTRTRSGTLAAGGGEEVVRDVAEYRPAAKREFMINVLQAPLVSDFTRSDEAVPLKWSRA